MGLLFNGNLVPVASGFANLGVEVGPNAQNAFDDTQGEVRPFNHIHQVSGIFHDPLHGQSGVLRFNQNAVAFEVSVDGGRTFNSLADKAGVDSVGVLGDTNLTGHIDLASAAASGFLAIFDTANASPIQFAVDQLGLSGLWDFPTQGFNGSVINELVDFHGTTAQGSITVQGVSGVIADIIGQTLTIGAPSVTLQGAYNNGASITTAAADGPVFITGDDTFGLALAQTENDHPHMLVSGVIEQPDEGQGHGAVWLQGHTGGYGPVQFQGGTVPTTRAAASAKSLGIDTWFTHTVSGIVSIRASSGVSQFFNAGNSDFIDDTGTFIPLNIDTAPSTFYSVTPTSGIQIYVPGLYKINYVSVFLKPQGNLAQQVETQLRVYDKWGQGFRLLGSESVAVIRNNNNLNRNTATGQAVADLRAGESLVLFAEHTGSVPAANLVYGEARRSNLIIEWIGPMSAGQATRQKI